MADIDLTQEMLRTYYAELPAYTEMERYYNGDHDIKYFSMAREGCCNQIIVENYIAKFVDEEVNYALGNPVSYISKAGNPDIINAIDTYLNHWRTNHNSMLMRDFEIYGKVYCLHYIDAKGRFSERILNPTNGICYTDPDGVPVRFIHLYKRQYDNSQYYDVYYPDSTIEIYRDNTLIQTRKHPFKGVPVSVCEMDNIHDTIFYKIRLLQDSYNKLLSDQASIIGDYRNAYLIVTGVAVNEEVNERLRKYGLLDLPSNGKAEWLMKEMNASYIENMITTIRNSMFSVCNHIDGNEKLQSNTSSLAIRSRLVFLEQRSRAMYDYISDAIYDRIERLFEYLAYKGLSFDIKDIKLNFTPNIPVDLTTTVQAISQLGDKISTETALSLLPFVENPLQEIEKIKKERAELEEIDLDKIGV